ncbi:MULTISPECIES: hypothetical protein [Vibrio]|jgi:hypothetical protein|uniref:hypothetical protein n=1 Tax=Vibrio TaxID=662 RepID=UPI0002E534AA|nr:MULTISPECIES: hypothetical protein [Vibrio]MBO7911294.1 hypothetical protein [Vibrio sp. G41H]MBT9241603.1 hypothetical protein [Vibrio splendidus]MCF7490129.1 hypothetical protein [Vibrio sp. G-C-1]MCQ8866328.1 hypothetical protein [Vibrio splendidus]MCT4350069.1 hypothetical protein [Vibrio sp. NC2]
MKTIKLMLSSVSLVFLSACGGGGGGGSSSASAPSSSAAQQAQKSIELVVPEGFDFSTEREVVVNVDVGSSQSSRGFMSIYTDFNGDVVDYTSQVLRTPINEDIDFSTTLLLPNHVDKVWVEVWYPSAMGSEVKRLVDINNGQVDVVL